MLFEVSVNLEHVVAGSERLGYNRILLFGSSSLLFKTSYAILRDHLTLRLRRRGMRRIKLPEDVERLVHAIVIPQ
jgi:hypothetical protein